VSQVSALVRADTLAMDSSEEEFIDEEESPSKKAKTVGFGNNSHYDGDDDEDTLVEPPKEVIRKRAVHTRKLNYSTTTVMRQLDQDGQPCNTVPLVSTMRSASYATRKVLHIAHQEKAQLTPNQERARKLLMILKSKFLPIDGFTYEHGEPSHQWNTKVSYYIMETKNNVQS
jgi:hypothetical protein